MVKIVKRIENGIKYDDIYLTRGDTLYLTAIPKDQDGNPYEPQEGDEIRFALKSKFTDSNPYLVKPVDIETFVMKLESEDTKNMPMDSKWVYDIELSKSNGDIATYIMGRFSPMKEVH